MICPKCYDDTLVLDNVNNVDENETYRLRKCKSCGHTYYTIEYEADPKSIEDAWQDNHRRG